MRFDKAVERERMVERQLAPHGVHDPAVMRAMRTVPRERFVPAGLVDLVYDDAPLPIAASQRMRRPYLIALMADALELEPRDKVLEIGTGTGYGAAVLAELTGSVFTIERQITLCTLARERLRALGYRNVRVRCGDGASGWPEEAPFDAIAVAAGGPALAQSLRGQLAIGGRLVLRVGDANAPRLVRIRRTEDTFEQEDLGA